MGHVTSTVIGFVDSMLKAWAWNSLKNEEESVTPSLLAAIDESMKDMRSVFGFDSTSMKDKIMKAFNNAHQDVIEECNETASLPHMTPEFRDAIIASLGGHVIPNYMVSNANTIKMGLIRFNDYEGYDDIVEEGNNGETSWFGPNEWLVSNLEDIVEMTLYDEAYVAIMTASYLHAENDYKFNSIIFKERIEDMLARFLGRTPVERIRHTRNIWF